VARRSPTARDTPRVAFTLLQAVAGAAVVARLARGRRRRPALRTDAEPPRATVSVVIPARDEQARLADCLAPLVRDPDVLEVIVVDDESTDATADVARGCGARLVSGRPLPSGWTEKAWALEQGLNTAAGEWIVFIDADARGRRARPRPVLAGGRNREGGGRHPGRRRPPRGWQAGAMPITFVESDAPEPLRVVVAGGGVAAVETILAPALVVAIGASPQATLPGSLTFGRPADVAPFRELLEALEAGRGRRVVRASDRRGMGSAAVRARSMR
jgi:Glycosyl transferase family 2